MIKTMARARLVVADAEILIASVTTRAMATTKTMTLPSQTSVPGVELSTTCSMSAFNPTATDSRVAPTPAMTAPRQRTRTRRVGTGWGEPWS